MTRQLCPPTFSLSLHLCAAVVLGLGLFQSAQCTLPGERLDWALLGACGLFLTWTLRGLQAQPALPSQEPLMLVYGLAAIGAAFTRTLHLVGQREAIPVALLAQGLAQLVLLHSLGVWRSRSCKLSGSAPLPAPLAGIALVLAAGSSVLCAWEAAHGAPLAMAVFVLWTGLFALTAEVIAAPLRGPVPLPVRRPSPPLVPSFARPGPSGGSVSRAPTEGICSWTMRGPPAVAAPLCSPLLIDPASRPAPSDRSDAPRLDIARSQTIRMPPSSPPEAALKIPPQRCDRPGGPSSSDRSEAAPGPGRPQAAESPPPPAPPPSVSCGPLLFEPPIDLSPGARADGTPAPRHRGARSQTTRVQPAPTAPPPPSRTDPDGRGPVIPTDWDPVQLAPTQRLLLPEAA